MLSKRLLSEISSGWFHLLWLSCLNTVQFPTGDSWSYNCSSRHEFLPQSVDPNETFMRYGQVGGGYNRSAKWSFCTERGYNITISIPGDKLDLKGKDCTEGGPYIEVNLTGVLKTRKHLCDGRTSGSDLPMVSSRCVSLSHCEGVSNGTFQFIVTAKIAGYIEVTNTPSTIQVKRKATFSQWMVLKTTSEEPVKHVLKFFNIKFRKINKKGKCNKVYIKITQGKNVTKYCPDNTIFNESFIEVIDLHKTNITFKYIKFDLNVTKYEIMPDSKIGPPNGITEPDQNTVVRNLAYVGLAFAVMFAVLAMAVVAKKIHKRRKKENEKRETFKPPDGLEASVYNAENDTSTLGKQQSMNNIMYEKVIKGNKKQVPMRRTSKDQQAISNNLTNAHNEDPCTRSPLLNAAMNKKQLRLSQLADKYIEVEIVNSACANKSRNYQLTSKQRLLSPPSQQVQPTCGPESSMSFHRIRPPVPPPNTNHLYVGEEENDYESINSPLTEKDLIPPAYATVVEDHENYDSKTAKFDFTSDFNIPLTEYISTNMSPHSQKNIPCDVYMSSDALQDIFHSSSNLDPEQDRYVGYLTPTLSENETYNKKYVIANDATQDCLKRHFKKPVPRPGKTTSSLPNLLDEDDESHSPHYISSPQQLASDDVRRMQPVPKLELPDSNKPVNGGRSNRYKQPRPSLPDIFIKCAYTSGEDITQIRNRLEKALSHPNESNDPGYDCPSTSIHESETSEQQFMYDSPRPSIDISRESILSEPTKRYYDTPRPSLPNIFPEDFLRKH